MAENNFKIINARFTHENIPIYKLEKFSFEDISAAYDAFKKISDVSECVIVQTASRVEIFLIINLETGDAPDARTRGRTLRGGLDPRPAAKTQSAAGNSLNWLHAGGLGRRPRCEPR